MINNEMKSKFDDLKPVNAPTVVISVEVVPSDLLSRLSIEVLKECQRLVPHVEDRDIGSLTSEDILKYLKTLLWLRVESVNGFSKAAQNYRRLYNRLSVPVMMYQLLIPIGEAIDKDFGIKFVPTYSISEGELLAPEDMSALSDIFTRLESLGLKIVYGLPKDYEGELDFMAMCSVEGIVSSYRNTHPVYGFLASFFQQKKLNEVTGMMCRVLYGYQTDYETYVSKVFSAVKSPTTKQKAHPKAQE